jgi:hypothetical protein
MNSVPLPDPQDSVDKTQSSNNSSEREQALREFRVMLRYVLGEGLELDDVTRVAVTAVEQAQPIMSADLSQIITAHIGLAKIVAPATPLSLEVTEVQKGEWLSSLRHPPLIMWMIIIALIAVTGFIATGVAFQAPAKGGGVDAGSKAVSMRFVPTLLGGRLLEASLVNFAGPETPSQGASPNAISKREEFHWLFAAALGAVFYVLFTAHGYVKDRTFDPRYNSIYLIRFVLGLLAGLILANVVAESSLLNKNSALSSLGPAVIALLGGFSTEAVYQVLQRLVDIMLAAVRGDGSDAAKAKAAQTAQNELMSLATDPTVTANPALLSKIHAAVQKVAQ